MEKYEMQEVRLEPLAVLAARDATRVPDLRKFKHNASRHGILSKTMLLPWEKKEEYEELRAFILQDLNPGSALELSCAEDIVDIHWRQRRCARAENAAQQNQLGELYNPNYYPDDRPVVDVSDVAKNATQMVPGQIAVPWPIMRPLVEMTPEEVEGEQRQIEKQLLILSTVATWLGRDNQLYHQAVKEIDEVTLKAWEKHLVEKRLKTKKGGWTAKAKEENVGQKLLEWIERLHIPRLEARQKTFNSARIVREHILATAFNAQKMAPYNRYEAQLDRKLEKKLSMLMKLQEIRLGRAKEKG